MRGGKPGYYPPIKGKGGPGGHFLLNLWDVLGNVEKMSPEKKERGLKVEILNGRAAMMGIMGLLSASTVRSRRPAVLRCLHAIDATRVHQTRSWVVSFSSLRPFGPRGATAMLRAGSASSGPT